jgi:hypothetical protein
VDREQVALDALPLAGFADEPLCEHGGLAVRHPVPMQSHEGQQRATEHMSPLGYALQPGEPG